VSRALPVLTGFAVIAVLLGLWQAAVALGFVSPLVAPAPSDIAVSFPQLITDEGLIQRFLQTFAEALVSAGLAVVVGTAIGWWLHAKRWAGLAFSIRCSWCSSAGISARSS
jgi:ABC-type nitrate/sulfonate/bicarbonate transport system permease component